MKTSYRGLAIALIAVGSLVQLTRLAAANANAKPVHEPTIPSGVTPHVDGPGTSVISSEDAESSTIPDLPRGLRFVDVSDLDGTPPRSPAVPAAPQTEPLLALGDGDEDADAMPTIETGEETLCFDEYGEPYYSASTTCPDSPQPIPTQCEWDEATLCPPTEAPVPTHCQDGTLPTACIKTDEEVSTVCPGGTLKPTICYDDSGQPFGLVTVCPGGFYIPTQCPDGSWKSTMCPIGGLTPTTCAGGTVSTLCPPMTLTPTYCPGGVQAATNCPGGGQWSTSCPDGSEVPTLCPGGIPVPSICPQPPLPPGWPFPI